MTLARHLTRRVLSRGKEKRARTTRTPGLQLTRTLNPLSESLTHLEAQGLHPVGALVRTHWNAVEEERHAPADGAPIAKT